MSKHFATEEAEMKARAYLVEYFNESEIVCEENADDVVTASDTTSAGVADQATIDQADCRAVTRGTLRGFEIYRVDDNEAEKTVSVSLISTPDTRENLEIYDQIYDRR